MRSTTDLESGQGDQTAPRAGVFSLFLLSSRPELLIDHEEGVGGIDSALPVSGAQEVVSRAETLDEISSPACCCIPSGVFSSIRGGSNINNTQRNVDNQSTQTEQGLSLAEVQIRAYFLMTVETSMT